MRGLRCRNGSRAGVLGGGETERRDIDGGGFFDAWDRADDWQELIRHKGGCGVEAPAQGDIRYEPNVSGAEPGVFIEDRGEAARK
jgi:hypothetical protein